VFRIAGAPDRLDACAWRRSVRRRARGGARLRLQALRHGSHHREVLDIGIRYVDLGELETDAGAATTAPIAISGLTYSGAQGNLRAWEATVGCVSEALRNEGAAQGSLGSSSPGNTRLIALAGESPTRDDVALMKRTVADD
jgi:hypothetical protein